MRVSLTPPLLSQQSHNLLRYACSFLWKPNKKVNTTMMNSEILSRGKADHLTVTSGNSRQNAIVPAKVTEVKDISCTVKLIKLDVQDPRFVFKAGQWVDMFIPGIDTVGGFSMCSDPQLLYSARIIHLAIKHSKHPPAFWMHSKCKVGDEVHLRAGGDFYYDPASPKSYRDLLLIAGGVGINPLYSILLHFHSLHHPSSKGDHPDGNSSSTSRHASMLFCAKSQEELLFSEEMQAISQTNKNVQLQLHCTRETTPKNSSVIYGRIKEEDVLKATIKLDLSLTEAFICGPSTFISNMESYCTCAGISKENIHYEKWW